MLSPWRSESVAAAAPGVFMPLVKEQNTMIREYSYDSYLRKIIHKIKLFQFKKIQGRRFHSIFINTLPKSGSLYLLTRITKGLRIHSMRISSGYFPLDIIDLVRLEEFLAGQFMCQGHVTPNPLNIRIVDASLDRMWLHVRDPRQALISMLHHLDRTLQISNALALSVSMPAAYGIKDWYGLSFEAKVDALIEGYYPDCIRFIEDWLACEKTFTRTKMLVTQHEDLKRSEEELLERVFDFYEVPRNLFELVQLKRNMMTHYRKGASREWASVMTPAQQERVTAALPKALSARFGW